MDNNKMKQQNSNTFNSHSEKSIDDKTIYIHQRNNLVLIALCLITKLHTHFLKALDQLVMVIALFIFIRIGVPTYRNNRYFQFGLLVIMYLALTENGTLCFVEIIIIQVFSVLFALPFVWFRNCYKKKAIFGILFVVFYVSILIMEYYFQSSYLTILHEIPVIFLFICCNSVIISAILSGDLIYTRKSVFFLQIPLLLTIIILIIHVNLLYTGWLKNNHTFVDSFDRGIEHIEQLLYTYILK